VLNNATTHSRDRWRQCKNTRIQRQIMNKERFLIKNTTIVNEGESFIGDVLLADGYIQQIGTIDIEPSHKVIDGLTHKGDLYTESKAAIAGGVTSFIDMPNTVPNILTVESLKEKYEIASQKSLANYSFFLGVNGDNIDDVIKMDTIQFIGVSDDGLYFTKKGNLLADNPEKMEKLFANCKSIIAIHSEKEEVIEANEQAFKKSMEKIFLQNFIQ
jgi:dihydroorotase